MGERTENVRDGRIGETMEGLARVISSRRGASPEESYTARLLYGPEDSLLKKLTEEATEVVMACKDDDHDHIRGHGFQLFNKFRFPYPPWLIYFQPIF